MTCENLKGSWQSVLSLNSDGPQLHTPTYEFSFVVIYSKLLIQVDCNVCNLPGLCDGSHPFVAVFDIFCAQLQRLLVLMTESDGEVELENTKDSRKLKS